MSATFAEILDQRHRRRLQRLALLGPRVVGLVALLGGARPGADPTPEELRRAFERLQALGGDQISLAVLDERPWVLRAVRALGEFHALKAQLRRLRKQIFSR